jgi:hypothetical protein
LVGRSEVAIFILFEVKMCGDVFGASGVLLLAVEATAAEIRSSSKNVERSSFAIQGHREGEQNMDGAELLQPTHLLRGPNTWVEKNYWLSGSLQGRSSRAHTGAKKVRYVFSDLAVR